MTDNVRIPVEGYETEHEDKVDFFNDEGTVFTVDKYNVKNLNAFMNDESEKMVTYILVPRNIAQTLADEQGIEFGED